MVKKRCRRERFVPAQCVVYDQHTFDGHPAPLKIKFGIILQWYPKLSARLDDSELTRVLDALVGTSWRPNQGYAEHAVAGGEGSARQGL